MQTNLSKEDQFDVLQKQLLTNLFKITKATTTLQPEAILLQKTENQDFANVLNQVLEKELTLCNQLLSFLTPTSSQKYTPFTDPEDIQERWMNVTEVINSGLEYADMALDRYYGRVPDTPASHSYPMHLLSTPSSSSSSSCSSSFSSMQTFSPSPGPNAMVATVKHANVSIQVVHATHISRPQELFKQDIDNSLTRPFVPKLKTKPHALVPLMTYPSTDQELQSYPVDYTFPHPYQYEIDHLTYPFCFSTPATEAELSLPTKLELSEMQWIDTIDNLESMIQELSLSPYLAVDLEHHSYRSYQGFLCLMQITSNTGKDYLIDTLALRMELHRLNVIFADPKIIKILHGADFDVIWLQRDLGCYIVNLFDTFHASKALHFPSHSLAYLLQHFCQLTSDKKYQLADWRLRPLPQEMVLYARMDTHYLIYIFHQLRTLLSSDRLHHVLHKSKEVSLKVHSKSGYDFQSGAGRHGWANVYAKSNRPLDPLRFQVFKHLHHWRDVTSREHDESTGYVLPNAMLLSMAMKLPTTAKEVLTCCHPIPPMIRTFANDLALLIKDSVEAYQAQQEQVNKHAQSSSSTSLTSSSSSSSSATITVDPQMYKKKRSRSSLSTTLSESHLTDSSHLATRHEDTVPLHSNDLAHSTPSELSSPILKKQKNSLSKSTNVTPSFHIHVKPSSEFLGSNEAGKKENENEERKKISTGSSYRIYETPKDIVQQNLVKTILSSLDHFEALLPKI